MVVHHVEVDQVRPGGDDRATSSPRRAKSAERMLGAMRTLALTAAPSQRSGRCRTRPGAPHAIASPARSCWRPDAGCGVRLRLAQHLLRQFAEAQPGRRQQPIAGLAGQRTVRLAEARQHERRRREIGAGGPEVWRDHGPQTGCGRGAQAVHRVLDRNAAGRRHPEPGKAHAGRCRVPASSHPPRRRRQSRRTSACPDFRASTSAELVDVDRGGRAGDREPAAGAARLVHQARDAFAQRHRPIVDEGAVEPRLLGMQVGDQRMQATPLAGIARQRVDVARDPLLAAGDLEQLTIPPGCHSQPRRKLSKARLKATRWASSVSASVPSTSKISASMFIVLSAFGAGPKTRLARMSATLQDAQLLAGQRAVGREQAVRLAQPRAVERIADRARVGEMRLRRRARCSARTQLRAGAERVVQAPQHELGDRSSSSSVVGKLDVMRDARAQAGIAAEERLHPVLVAREDHDEIVALVLHHLQQDLDRFLAVVALVLRAIEVVRLVDEEHAAHRPLQHLLGLGRGVADVLADEIVARDRDQVPCADVAEPVQDVGHAQRDRRLAGAGIAGEAHVQRRRLGCRAARRARTRSTSSSAAISRMRVFTGARPTARDRARRAPPDAGVANSAIEVDARRPAVACAAVARCVGAHDARSASSARLRAWSAA